MLEKVRDFVGKYHMLSPGDVVVAGISGGADSVCLLFVLEELQREIPFRLLAVHINHGIRPEAWEDAAYVEGLCKEKKIPFFLVKKDVKALASREKISVEEAGRKARYEAFEQILYQEAPEEAAAGRGKIAVAHNSNDRAETLLFHLFRGSGIPGLCSIPPVRNNIIRPILCMERAEIEAELAGKGIAYCTDATNEQDEYTRNKIRHHILPYAEREIVSGALGHMNNTSDILTEVQDFVQECTLDAYNQCVSRDSLGRLRLGVEELEKQHIFIRKELYLLCLEELASTRKDISSIHVQEVESLVSKTSNRTIHLPYGILARREYGQIVLEKRRDTAPEIKKEWVIFPENGYSIEVPNLGILDFQVLDRQNPLNICQNQYTKWFDYDKMKKSLKVRTRRTGDYLTINENLSRKSVQDYMVNEKIPKEQRDSTWLLTDDNHVIWVIGYRISQAYKIDAGTKRILQIQIRGGHEL